MEITCRCQCYRFTKHFYPIPAIVSLSNRSKHSEELDETRGTTTMIQRIVNDNDNNDFLSRVL